MTFADKGQPPESTCAFVCAGLTGGFTVFRVCWGGSWMSGQRLGQILSFLCVMQCFLTSRVRLWMLNWQKPECIWRIMCEQAGSSAGIRHVEESPFSISSSAPWKSSTCCGVTHEPPAVLAFCLQLFLHLCLAETPLSLLKLLWLMTAIPESVSAATPPPRSISLWGRSPWWIWRES